MRLSPCLEIFAPNYGNFRSCSSTVSISPRTTLICRYRSGLHPSSDLRLFQRTMSTYNTYSSRIYSFEKEAGVMWTSRNTLMRDSRCISKAHRLWKDFPPLTGFTETAHRPAPIDVVERRHSAALGGSIRQPQYISPIRHLAQPRNELWKQLIYCCAHICLVCRKEVPEYLSFQTLQR